MPGDRQHQCGARDALGGSGPSNWLLAGSKADGDRTAAVYSVIESAKHNTLEPQAYIADIIAKIAGYWPAARWDEVSDFEATILPLSRSGKNIRQLAVPPRLLPSAMT